MRRRKPLVKPGEIIGHRLGLQPSNEADHFYRCPRCGQPVDKRDLGQVLHHEEKGHKPLPPS
jgi:hypothetical protein